MTQNGFYNGADYLHCVLLTEFSFCSQICEKLTTWDVLHEEVEVAGVLGEPLQTDL